MMPKMGRGRYDFVWDEHLIGFPLEDGDVDFAGARTPPVSTLTIAYRDADTALRQSVSRSGLIRDIENGWIRNVKGLLVEWLRAELRNR